MCGHTWTIASFSLVDNHIYVKHEQNVLDECFAKSIFLFVAYSILNAYCIILMLYIFFLLQMFKCILRRTTKLVFHYVCSISQKHILFLDTMFWIAQWLKHNFITVMHCMFGVYVLRNVVVVRLLITLAIMLSSVSDMTPWINIKQC